jgi:hypothetical protein
MVHPAKRGILGEPLSKGLVRGMLGVGVHKLPKPLSSAGLIFGRAAICNIMLLFKLRQTALAAATARWQSTGQPAFWGSPAGLGRMGGHLAQLLFHLPATTVRTNRLLLPPNQLFKLLPTLLADIFIKRHGSMLLLKETSPIFFRSIAAFRFHDPIRNRETMNIGIFLLVSSFLNLSTGLEPAGGSEFGGNILANCRAYAALLGLQQPGFFLPTQEIRQ